MLLLGALGDDLQSVLAMFIHDELHIGNMSLSLQDGSPRLLFDLDRFQCVSFTSKMFNAELVVQERMRFSVAVLFYIHVLADDDDDDDDHDEMR